MMTSLRLHDLKTVHLNFQIVLKLLKSGYRFDDEEAPGLFQQLEKSLQTLKIEIDSLEKNVF